MSSKKLLNFRNTRFQKVKKQDSETTPKINKNVTSENFTSKNDTASTQVDNLSPCESATQKANQIRLNLQKRFATKNNTPQKKQITTKKTNIEKECITKDSIIKTSSATSLTEEKDYSTEPKLKTEIPANSNSIAQENSQNKNELCKELHLVKEWCNQVGLGDLAINIDEFMQNFKKEET